MLQYFFCAGHVRAAENVDGQPLDASETVIPDTRTCVVGDETKVAAPSQGIPDDGNANEPWNVFVAKCIAKIGVQFEKQLPGGKMMSYYSE